MRDVLVVVSGKYFLRLLVFFFYCIHTHAHTRTHELPKFSRFLCFHGIYLWYGYIQNIPLGCMRLKLYCSRHGLYQRANQKIVPQIFISFVLRNNVIVFAFLTTPHRAQLSLHLYMLTGHSTFFCVLWLVFATQCNSGALQLQKFSFFHFLPRFVCV